MARLTKLEHMTLIHLHAPSLAKSPLPPFNKGGSAKRGGFTAAARLYESCVVRFRNRPFVAPRRVWRVSLAVLVCLIASPSLAHAHGGMAGPAELGPPIFTSGLLGFVCYWLVILWPSSKKKSDTAVGSGTQNKSATRTRRRSHKNSAHVKRAPRLRKIERSGQFGSDQNSGRRATDG